jgi:hypothetical protein
MQGSPVGVKRTNGSFVGTRLHILFSFRCAGGTGLSAESAARAQHWRVASALGNCDGRAGGYAALAATRWNKNGDQTYTGRKDLA